MNSGIKFVLNSLAAILFISGLNSFINGDDSRDFTLWMVPFLCIGIGIVVPIQIIIYEAYLHNGSIDSDDANDVITNHHNSEPDSTD